MTKTNLLFLVILIEGYAVLASELLAIRLMTPFVGSGIDTTSILISGVLLPLAIGYHFGGVAYSKAFRQAKEKGRRDVTIRKILARNITAALCFFVFGFSHSFLELFFKALSQIGLSGPLIQTAIYSAVFLVTPTFLLGQTVPLISHFFSRRKLNAITGRMLFFSTLGSFLGSLFSTLVLMSFLGVHNTVIITIFVLVLLVWMIAGKKCQAGRYLAVAALLLAWFLNNNEMMRSKFVVSNNAYNLVMVNPFKDSSDKLFRINQSYSSLYSDIPENRFEYIKYIERHFITPTMKDGAPPIDILTLGAGGFSLGQFDTKNRYVYVDIDKDLKELAEKNLFGAPLSPNKSFVGASARSFILNDTKKYDLIVIDVFTMVRSIPAEAVTREFLAQVKERLKKGGVVVANVITTPSFEDAFSVRYYNTFASVFPRFSRVVLEKTRKRCQDELPQSFREIANVLHIYVNHEHEDDQSIYTDDKNTPSLDVKDYQ